jgi:hypothetical protein
MRADGADVNRWWGCWAGLLGLGPIFLLVWWYDRSEVSSWIGHTDLEVQLTVTDASSCRPIPGARIEVESWGTMEEGDDEQRKFELHTDMHGVALKACGKARCSGESSRLRFTNSFSVYRPWWYFRVYADGYEPSDRVDLHLSGNLWKAERTGGGRSRLFVDVSLQRKP